MTVKNALSSGYSGGSGSVGFDPRIALNAARLNGSISDGCTTTHVGDVAVPVDVELQHDAAAERIAACGTNQLRRTCATNRRIQGPNSTPLVSN